MLAKLHTFSLSLLSNPHRFCSAREGLCADFVIHFSGELRPVARIGDAAKRFPGDSIRVSQPTTSTLYRLRS